MPESNQLTEQPTVSVVVASYNSWESLEQCLSSLAGQQTVEVIVADCSDSDHTPALAARFPSVKFRHFNHRMSIPQLRWAGVRQSTGDIVALTECWMLPSPDWVAALRETHVKHPAAPAVGGPVDFPPRGQSAPLFLWADYFSDHIQYMPPADDGYRDELPGHNCSYRRWVFDEFSDLIERGAWDPLIHRRLKNRGYHLRFAGRAVVHYCGHLPRRKILSQRFHYGRWFAGELKRGMGVPERILRAILSPLVPFLMLRRAWKAVSLKAGRRRLAQSAPWLLVFYVAWSFGEGCGYLFGSGSSEHRIF